MKIIIALNTNRTKIVKQKLYLQNNIIWAYEASINIVGNEYHWT